MVRNRPRMDQVGDRLSVPPDLSDHLAIEIQSIGVSRNS